MNQAHHVELFRMDRIALYREPEPVLPSPEDVRQAFLDGGCERAFPTADSVTGVMPGGKRVTAVRHERGWRINGDGRSGTEVVCAADLVELTRALRLLRGDVREPKPAA